MIKIIFDYRKLEGKIKEIFGTQKNMAKAMGMGRNSLNLRLNNRAEFKPKDIKVMAMLLGIKESEYYEYFFTEKVQKNELSKDKEVV